MKELFSNYGHTIVFLHILSAFIWVGGMIIIRFTVHPTMQTIDDGKIKLGKTLQIMGKLFNLVLPFIIYLLISGLVMSIALNGHHTDQKALFITKEIIWTIMTLNYVYMYVKRKKAWSLFEAGDLPLAKAQVANIPNLLLPLNIVLGVIALWIGVSLRGL